MRFLCRRPLRPDGRLRRRRCDRPPPHSARRSWSLARRPACSGCKSAREPAAAGADGEDHQRRGGGTPAPQPSACAAPPGCWRSAAAAESARRTCSRAGRARSRVAGAPAPRARHVLVIGEIGLHRCPARAGEPVVDEGLQLFLADGRGGDGGIVAGHFTLRSSVVRPVSKIERSLCRARDRRDITVPIGMPRIRAASS